MRVQVAWAILSATWNAGGVAMIAQGGRSPGPTASIAAAIVLIVMAIAYPMTIRRWPVVYLLVSLLGGLAAIAAVVNAFTADPKLWPSEFWRYAGAVLNGVGFFAALAGIVSVVRNRNREAIGSGQP